MYVILGIAIFWIIMANVVHKMKGYDWKKSFLLAPVYLIALFIEEFFSGGDSGSAE